MGGLRRELVNAFWNEYKNNNMDGNSQKVPQVFPNNLSEYFHLGRFLSHVTGYFLSPICSTAQLVSSFLEFVDQFKAEAICQCMAPAHQNEDLLKTVIIPMLSRFNVFSIPTCDTLPDLVLLAARYCFLEKPYFALSEMRRGMIASHPSLWKRCSTTPIIKQLYVVLTPTIHRVWNLIREPNLTCAAEETTFDYLRRFIHSLSVDLLGKFLSFLTGFSVCAENIKIIFNKSQGIQRRPTSTTCTMTLHLPTMYNSFTAFTDEFRLILANSSLWFFDVY